MSLGRPLDLVLFADTGSERPETYEFIPVFRRWLDDHDIENHIVRYQPKRFKHWPPYATLLENLLTNGTLPSITFARHSCSLKWKVEPQHRYVKNWAPARECWARGEKCVKLIGYDAGPSDTRRYRKQEAITDDHYMIVCPLREWGWDRLACARRIRAAGLPVPVKSACFFCIAQSAAELRTLPRAYLRLIILLEARAAPRLRNVEGLWRRTTKTRPGRMTTLIRAEGLLPPDEVDEIVAHAPLDLVSFQAAAAATRAEAREPMRSWLERFQSGTVALAA